MPDALFEDALASLNSNMRRAIPTLAIGRGNIALAKQELLASLKADIELAKERNWDNKEALAHANKRAMFRVTQSLNNLEASHKQETYINNNILSFQWQSMEDNRVRPRHEHLDGMVFEYERPPIANIKKGLRFLPGQDWGCRCVDTPIIT